MSWQGRVGQGRAEQFWQLLPAQDQAGMDLVGTGLGMENTKLQFAVLAGAVRHSNNNLQQFIEVALSLHLQSTQLSSG